MSKTRNAAVCCSFVVGLVITSSVACAAGAQLHEANGQLQCTDAWIYELPDSHDLLHECERRLNIPGLNASERTKALYVKGYALYTLGKFAEAEKDLREVLEVNPRHYAAMNWMAFIEISVRGNFEHARAYLNEAIEIKPDWARSHYHLALVAEMQGQAGEALKHYTRAIKLKPTFAWARYRRARLNFGIARWDAVLADTSYLAENKGKFGKITKPEYYQRKVDISVVAAILHGKTLHRLTRYKEAETWFDKLVEKERSAVTLTARSRFLSSLPFGVGAPPRFDDSSRDAKAALAIDPHLSFAHIRLGRNYASAGQYAAALKAIEAGIASHMKDEMLPGFMWSKAKALRELNQFEQASETALKTFRLAWSLNREFAFTKFKELAQRGYFVPPKNEADLERAMLDALTACMLDHECD